VTLTTEVRPAGPDPAVQPNAALANTRPPRVPDDIRRLVRDEGMTRATPLRAGGHTLALIGIWVGLSAVGLSTGTLWVWAPVWLVQAVLLHGAYSAMHDGAHGTMFRSRWANRLVNLGWSVPLLLNAGLWRAWHLEHHRATVTGDDPEPKGELTNVVMYLGAFPVAGLSMISAFWWHSLLAVAGRPPGYARRTGVAPTARRDGVLLLGLTAAVAVGAVTRPFLLLALWGAPFIGYWLVVSLVFGLAEHYHTREAGGQLDVTRSVRSHGPVRFVLWNSNYHAAHHLVPSVTYRYLPKLDDAVGDRALHRSRSYLAFHAGQLHGVMPGRRSPRHP